MELTESAYQRKLNVRNSSTESMIQRLIGRSQKTGYVHDLPASGRRISAHTGEHIERVLNSTEEE